MTRKVIFTFFAILSFCLFNNTSIAEYTQGYKIITEAKKAMALNCYDSEKGAGDQSLCDKYSLNANAQCETIESSTMWDEPVYMCNGDIIFCFKDSDCKALGKNACVISQGSTKKFADQADDGEDLDAAPPVIGVCVAFGGSGEDNAFGKAICNLMNVVTGNAGRAVVGVVVIVVGIMFFLGKVTWSLVLAIALGAGAIFGAPAIVKVVTGKAFLC